MYYSFDFRELTVDKPGLGCLNLCCCCCFGAGVRLVTQIQILKAEGLERQDVGSGKCLKVLFCHSSQQSINSIKCQANSDLTFGC